jgi:hypothetical protein
MATTISSKMLRLYAGPRSSTGSFGPSLTQMMVTSELTRSVVTLPALSDGTVTSFEGANSTLTVRVSGQIDSGWSVSRVDGAGVTSTLVGSTVTVTALSTDTATITLTATKSGFSPVTNELSVAKIKQGVEGEQGVPGANGTSGDSVDIIFIRATTQPATPAASASTPVGWYSTADDVPAGEGWIWSCVGTSMGGTFDYIWQLPLKVEGSDGANGLSIVELTIFRRATSTPATPTGGTYNFSTRMLTPPDGWLTAVPTGTDPVYTSRAVASSTNPAATSVAPGTWTGPVVSFQNGTDGAAGDSVDIVFIRATTQPATPAASASTPVGWYSTVNDVPAGSGWIWSCVGTKTGVMTTYTWQTPVQIEGSDGANGADGANGLSIVELTIFRRATSTPTTPTGGTYNFSTKVLTPPSGWLTAVPTGTDPVYTSRSVVSSTNPSATSVAPGTWTTPVVSFQNGATGATGPNGTRGTVNLIASGSSWSDTTANNAITSATGSSTKIIGDIVTITNNTSFSQTRAWNGSSWLAAAAYINGNMIVAGTLVADQVAAGTLTGSTVRTSSGTTRVELSTVDNGLSSYVSGSRVAGIGGSADGLVWAVTSNSSTAVYGYSNTDSNDGEYGVGTISNNGIYGVGLNASVGVTGRCFGSAAGVFGVASTASTGAGVLGVSKAAGPAVRAAAASTSTTDKALYVKHERPGSTYHGARIENAGALAATTAKALVAVGGSNFCFYAEVGTYGPFTASHDGVMLKTIPAEQGDIIIDVSCAVRNGIADAIFDSNVSNTPNQKNAIGIFNSRKEIESSWTPAAAIDRTQVSDKPVAKPEYLDLADTHDLIDILSVGEGYVNVCGENGDIEAGDLIVTSSLPGKGMRQADDLVRATTVAKSREAVTFDSPTQVKQVACIYLCG